MNTLTRITHHSHTTRTPLVFPEPTKTMNIKLITVAVISVIIIYLSINIKENYNAQNSAAAGSSPAYKTLASYGDYRPFITGYRYADVADAVNDSAVVKRCAAGPYTYASNSEMAAMCKTIPRDVIDRVDCHRVEKVRYQSPAFGKCGSFNDQLSPGYVVTGSPQLKYPVILPLF